MTNSLFQRFAALHVPGDPLVLFNAWDAGSAQAVAKAGSKAVATGSASVAMANGFGDGQDCRSSDGQPPGHRDFGRVSDHGRFRRRLRDGAGGLSANGQRIMREVPLPLNTLEEMAREAIA